MSEFPENVDFGNQLMLLMVREVRVLELFTNEDLFVRNPANFGNLPEFALGQVFKKFIVLHVRREMYEG